MMSAQADPTQTTEPLGARQLDVMVVDQWLIFDCPHCSQTIKLDRKDSVHPIECPACGSGFEPLLDREVKLPPRKVSARKRRRRSPRGTEAADAEPLKKTENRPRSRPTASSLPSDGVVKLTLRLAEQEETEPEDESPLSRLPVRSALELERRRVEALDPAQVQPDEKELNAVIEAQSGGKYKRIRVRTRKKRLTEKQRLAKLVVISGLSAVVVIGFTLWTASKMFKSDDEDAEAVEGSATMVYADSEPIGAPIGNRGHLLRQLLKAEDVDILLKLIRNPKRLEPLIRDFYGGSTLPPLTVKDFRSVGGKGDLPLNFTHVQMITGSSSLPIYIEKTDSHGYRLDWESFVGYGTMPWKEFIDSKATKTARMRVYLSDAEFYEPDSPFTKDRFNCLKIEDPTRSYTLYGYYNRNEMRFRRLAESIFEAQSNAKVSDVGERAFEMSVILDLRYPPGALHAHQVEIVEFVTDSWLRP